MRPLRALLIIMVVLSGALAYGESPKSESAATDAAVKPKATPNSIDLFLSNDVYTRESIVEMGGKKFRKIEVKGEIFFLQLLRNDETAQNLVLLCAREGAKMNPDMPAQIVGSVAVTKRTHMFVEGLRQACVSQQAGGKIEITPDIQIGFMFDDDVNSNAIFKKKRIFINPVSPMIGFGAQW